MEKELAELLVITLIVLLSGSTFVMYVQRDNARESAKAAHENLVALQKSISGVAGQLIAECFPSGCELEVIIARSAGGGKFQTFIVHDERRGGTWIAAVQFHWNRQSELVRIGMDTCRTGIGKWVDYRPDAIPILFADLKAAQLNEYA